MTWSLICLCHLVEFPSVVSEGLEVHLVELLEPPDGGLTHAGEELLVRAELVQLSAPTLVQIRIQLRLEQAERSD